jgi:hypothetical protein
VLADVVAPAGTSVHVTAFTLPGSTTVYPAGTTAVPVVDPASGQTTGTVVVLRNGTIAFTPAAGFAGQVPAITYVVASSDGQTSAGALSLVITTGERSGLRGRICMPECALLGRALFTPACRGGGVSHDVPHTRLCPKH